MKILKLFVFNAIQNIGDNAMRHLFVLLACVCYFSQAPDLLAASSGKVKHLETLYEDSEQIALNSPEGIGCSENYILVADTGNSRLLGFSLDNQTLTGDSVIPLPDTSPLAVQMNSKGDIYVLDGKARRINKLNRAGEPKGLLEPGGLPDPKDFVPRSFKIDQNDNIYVLDILSERVIVLSPDERYLRHISFPEKYGFFSDLTISSQGTVYLVDSVDAAVFSAEAAAESFSPLAQGMKKYMNFPTSIAIDKEGFLYLADQYGSGVAVIGRDGSFQGRKLGMGWKESQLYYPTQICINEQNILVVADRNNNRVQVFTVQE